MKRLFFPMFTVSKCVSCGKRVAGNAVKMCVDCGRRYATERAKSCSVCGFPHELCRCALNAGGGLYRVLHAVP